MHETPPRERATSAVNQRVEHDPVADAQAQRRRLLRRAFGAVRGGRAEPRALDALVVLLVTDAAQDGRAPRLGARARGQ